MKTIRFFALMTCLFICCFFSAYGQNQYLELRFGSVDNQTNRMNSSVDTTRIWETVTFTSSSGPGVGLLYHWTKEQQHWTVGLQYVALGKPTGPSIFNKPGAANLLGTDPGADVQDFNIRSRVALQWNLHTGSNEKIKWLVGPTADLFYQSIQYQPGRSDIFPYRFREYGLIMGPSLNFHWSFYKNLALRLGMDVSLFRFSNQYNKIENPVLTEAQQEQTIYNLEIDFNLNPVYIGLQYGFGE